MIGYSRIDSPVGELLLTGELSRTGAVLASVSMAGQRSVRPDWVHAPEAFAEAARQLEEYFAGRRTAFDLEFAVAGGEFHRRVWQALDGIPYGTTTTYGALARSLGLPRERVQAVGAAVGANPLLIVRPCHRVIGADGTMRGYAGGVRRKEQLLRHEGALQPTLI